MAYSSRSQNQRQRTCTSRRQTWPRALKLQASASVQPGSRRDAKLERGRPCEAQRTPPSCRSTRGLRGDPCWGLSTSTASGAIVVPLAASTNSVVATSHHCHGAPSNGCVGVAVHVVVLHRVQTVPAHVAVGRSLSWKNTSDKPRPWSDALLLGAGSSLAHLRVDVRCRAHLHHVFVGGGNHEHTRGVRSKPVHRRLEARSSQGRPRRASSKRPRLRRGSPWNATSEL